MPSPGASVALGSNSATFTVRVRLPPPFDKSVFVLVPASSTVDHVKNEVFKASCSLNAEVAEDYALGVSEEELLYVEFVKLAMCHKNIRDAVAEDRTVQLFLIPKGRKFLHARPSPGMASPYRLPRMARARETAEEEKARKRGRNSSERGRGQSGRGRDHSLMCAIPSRPREEGMATQSATSSSTATLARPLPDLSVPAPDPPPLRESPPYAKERESNAVKKGKKRRRPKKRQRGQGTEEGDEAEEAQRGKESNGGTEKEGNRATEKESSEGNVREKKEANGMEVNEANALESIAVEALKVNAMASAERENKEGKRDSLSLSAEDEDDTTTTEERSSGSESEFVTDSDEESEWSHSERSPSHSLLKSSGDSELLSSDEELPSDHKREGRDRGEKDTADAIGVGWEAGDRLPPLHRLESVEEILSSASVAVSDPAEKFTVAFHPIGDETNIPLRITAEGTTSFYTFVPASTSVNSTRIMLINQLQRALDVLNDESHVIDVETKSVLNPKFLITERPEGGTRHLQVVTRPTMEAGTRSAADSVSELVESERCTSPEYARIRKVGLPAQRSSDCPIDDQAATQIGNLLGNALYQATNGPQAINFRSKMAKLFSSRYQGDKPQDVMRARITNSRLPETIGSKILCKFFVAKKSTSNTVHAHVSDSFLDVVSKVVMSHARRQILSKSSYESDDFFVKIQGSSEYVLDDVPVGSLVRVRELVKNNQPVCFVLISKEEKKIKDQIDAFLKSEQEQMAACKILDIHLDGVEKMVSNYTAVSEVRRPFELRIVALEFTSELLEEEGLEAEPNLSPRSPRGQLSTVSRGNRSTTALNVSSSSVSNSSASAVSNGATGGGGGGVGGGGVGGAGQKYVYVECCLYHGVEKMSASVRTKAQKKERALFVESVFFDILICDIPKATRACFVLYEASSPTGQGKEIGWVNVQLVDYSNELRSGVLYVGLWCDSPSSPIGSCEPNSKSALALTIELPRNQIPILFVPDPALSDSSKRTPAPLRQQQAPSDADQDVIEELLRQDAIYQATEEEKQLMWRHRNYYRNVPRSIVKLLLSVPWNSSNAVEEAHEMLREWAPLNPYEGLELLDAKFADAHVRRFGVNCLAQLNHEELAAIMLQLVQVLKYEPYHDSALARFLLQRALSNRQLVGHAFFWHLHSELHVEQISERYVLLAEVYLRCSGAHRSELVQQLAATRRIHELAVLMQNTPAGKRTHTLRNNLRCLGMPTKFKLPSNPRMEVEEIMIDKCKTKDSFTAPLWLVFKVRDMVPSPSYVPVIFKAGDDLRQDALTLQMFRLMDEVWKREGLDMHMSIYSVLASGDSAGYIEVVQNSASLADIQKNAGGIVTAAFAKTTLQRWIRQHSQTEAQYEMAVKKFIFSCAGYSVATYLLGLGDRHNDNIMVSTSGHLFHIDFAHFLGNIMKWKGIKRETAPFVLTPAIAHVMGGVKSEQFQFFRELCGKAFNILRKHSHVFITLLALMVSTGIPQLNSFEDIHFLRNAFMLHLSDAEAEAAFLKLIDKCLSSLATKVNFMVHLMAHPGKDT